MLVRQSSVSAIFIVFILIYAEILSESTPKLVGNVFSAKISVADEVGKNTAQGSLSVDFEQSCALSRTRLNQLDASTRTQVCNELKEMRESLQRVQSGIASFREFIIASGRRCDEMDVLVVESTKSLRSLREKILGMEIERDQLRLLL